MELNDVVRKLVGPISPVGDTQLDEERFENLKTLTALISDLLGAVDDVAANACRTEFSMKRAGLHASRFFDELGIVK